MGPGRNCSPHPWQTCLVGWGPRQGGKGRGWDTPAPLLGQRLPLPHPQHPQASPQGSRGPRPSHPGSPAPDLPPAPAHKTPVQRLLPPGSPPSPRPGFRTQLFPRKGLRGSSLPRQGTQGWSPGPSAALRWVRTQASGPATCCLSARLLWVRGADTAPHPQPPQRAGRAGAHYPRPSGPGLTGFPSPPATLAVLGGRRLPPRPPTAPTAAPARIPTTAAPTQGAGRRAGSRPFAFESPPGALSGPFKGRRGRGPFPGAPRPPCPPCPRFPTRPGRRRVLTAAAPPPPGNGAVPGCPGAPAWGRLSGSSGLGVEGGTQRPRGYGVPNEGDKGVEPPPTPRAGG